MKKVFKRILVTVMVCALLVGSMAIGAGAAEVGTYNRVDEIQDWGAATTKVVVSLGREVAAQTVATDSFTVYVRRVDNRLDTPLLEEGARRVTAAYLSDSRGNRTNAGGEYVTLELEIGPDISLGSPLNYGIALGGSRRNEYIDCQYTITQTRAIGGVSGIVANRLDEQIVPVVDDFASGSHAFNDPKWGRVNLTYASFDPQTAGSSALIVWLHGGGEGGTDTAIPLSANRAGAFATPEIQNYFGAAGAHVLAPQSPTQWMDDDNVSGNNPISSSKYTGALMDLIDKYVQDHPDIDPGRVYVGGCSNGGFQTMELILAYPNYFAAAFPVCEALADSVISDEDIQILKDQSIWFVAAATDDTVIPGDFMLPTYERLIAAGAKDVRCTYFDNVSDRSGLYTDADGNPHEYDGHWSWIYVYNDEVKDGTLSLYDWMAARDNLIVWFN